MIRSSHDLPVKSAEETCLDCEDEKIKMQAGEESIRIHTVLHSSTSDKSFFTSSTGAFQRAVAFFSNAFLVNRRTSVLRVKPECSIEYTGYGKCYTIRRSPLKCGPFDVPDDLKEAAEECRYNSNTGAFDCTTVGSTGAGANADYILFAGAVDS